MKRKIIILLVLCIILPMNVFAASGSVRASSSSSKVTLNNTFTVSVKVNSDVVLGSWQFDIEYDSSKLSLQSGDTRVVGYGDGTFSSKTYTYKFKAVGLGSSTVSVSNAKIADYDTVSYISTTTAGTTVSISEAVSVVYSSDNNLSSLSIDEIEISPAFKKGTLEYQAVAEPGTTSVKINAKASSNKASVTGTGDVEVIEGDNDLNIVVKAENGATKTYKIKLTVPEKNPIEVKVGKETFNILRKLPEEKPLNFTDKTITINEEEIPALYNEKLKMTLVYAKDSTGKLSYYIYQNNKITKKYIEATSDNLTIYLTNTDEVLKGYSKTKIKINDEQVEAYQLYEDSKYYLVYGINVLTNKEGYYIYDSVNKTFQLFDLDTHNYFNKTINDNKIIIYALSSCLVIFILITILLGRNVSKLKKIQTNTSLKKNVKKKNTNKLLDEI